MADWTWSQWIIIPLLFLTCMIVAAGLIGLLFGPFISGGYQLLRGRLAARTVDKR